MLQREDPQSYFLRVSMRLRNATSTEAHSWIHKKKGTLNLQDRFYWTDSMQNVELSYLSMHLVIAFFLKVLCLCPVRPRHNQRINPYVTVKLILCFSWPGEKCMFQTMLNRFSENETNNSEVRNFFLSYILVIMYADAYTFLLKEICLQQNINCRALIFF